MECGDSDEVERGYYTTTMVMGCNNYNLMNEVSIP